MRWFLLLVVVVLGLLLLYDDGFSVQDGQSNAVTPIAPTPTPWLSSSSTTFSIPIPTLDPNQFSIATPEPLWKLFEGVWMRVWGFDRLEFSQQFVEIKASADSTISTHTVNYALQDDDHIWISWGIGVPGLTYSYEFKNDYNTLILTNIDTGDRFIYVRQSGYVERQPETATLPQPLMHRSIILPTTTPTPLTPTIQPAPTTQIQIFPRPQETDIGSPTKAAMVLEYYGEDSERYTPEYLREIFIEVAKATGRYDKYKEYYEKGGIYNQDIIDGLRPFGYEWQQDCREITPDEDFNQRLRQLQDNLIAGRPVLMGIYDEDIGYNVILVGYDPTKREYTYLDPEQVSVSEEELNKMWREAILGGSQRCIIFTSPKS